MRYAFSLTLWMKQLPFDPAAKTAAKSLVIPLAGEGQGERVIYSFHRQNDLADHAARFYQAVRFGGLVQR